MVVASKLDVIKSYRKVIWLINNVTNCCDGYSCGSVPKTALMEQGHKYPHGGMVYATVLEAVLMGLSSNLSEGTYTLIYLGA